MVLKMKFENKRKHVSG